MQNENNKGFYTQLEGLRGVAVVLVLISHFVIIKHFPKLNYLQLGFWGVNLFFVLSGFLITESLLKEKYNGIGNKLILKKFFIKRVLRIFPIYYLVVIVSSILKVEDLQNLLGWSLTYTLNIKNIWFGKIPYTISHFWSLCVEEQFYLIWPFLILYVGERFHKNLIIGSIVFALLCRFIYTINYLPGYDAFDHDFMFTCLDSLCLGALLSYLKLNNEALLTRILKKWVIPAGAFILFFILSYYSTKEDLKFRVLDRFLTSISGFFIVGFGALNISTFYSGILNNRIVRYLGKISYGIYVYHMVFFVLFSNKFLELWREFTIGKISIAYYNAWFASFLFFLFLSIGIASISFHFIEMPFLKLKGRLSR